MTDTSETDDRFGLDPNDPGFDAPPEISPADGINGFSGATIPDDDPNVAQRSTRQENGGGKDRIASLVAKFQTDDQFLADATVPRYLLKGILARGWLYTFTAATGSGKTAVALRLAESVVTGQQFCGVDVKPGNVLFLAGENPDDVRYRWYAAREIGNFAGAEHQLHILPLTGPIDQIAKAARLYLDAAGIEIALVVVDAFQAYFSGDDDNSNVQMKKAASMLRVLSDLPGDPTIVVPVHPVKNAARDNLIPRGGSALINEVDGNLTLWGGDGSATLHWAGKIRGPQFDPLNFEINEVQCATLLDEDGDPMTTVRAEPMLEGKATSKAMDRAQMDLDVLRLIKGNGRMSEREIASQVGCNRSMINTVKKRITAQKWIKKRGAVTELLIEGKRVLKANEPGDEQ
jgi:hypothetical protein